MFSKFDEIEKIYRAQIRNVIINQAHDILRLDSAEEYYCYYSMIDKFPLEGEFKRYEKKLYDDFLLTVPFARTMIDTYKKDFENQKGIRKI